MACWELTETELGDDGLDGVDDLVDQGQDGGQGVAGDASEEVLAGGGLGGLDQEVGDALNLGGQGGDDLGLGLDGGVLGDGLQGLVYSWGKKIMLATRRSGSSERAWRRGREQPY